MNYFCNPLNMEYRFQFDEVSKDKDGKKLYRRFREAADPSLILFKGKYWLFPSKTGGFLTSDNLVEWEFHKFKNKMPIHDYAPDVRAIGDYIYFCASNGGENPFYRSKNPIDEEFEKIDGSFGFWDPNLFEDEDGRFYFYWGSSDRTPIYGVELDRDTMKMIGEPVGVIFGNDKELGFDRSYDDYKPNGLKYRPPYIEGAWMNKENGKYYLQYAGPGTEFNTYFDGVYVSDSPLGPFHIAKNNPYSYKPCGFVNGAGHGSTMKDKNGELWHTATMRISNIHMFERRLGLWKAGIDGDGELFCDQRYGDWPTRIDAKVWDKPDFMLLSYKKAVKASSGKNAQNAADEDIRTYWRADERENQWIELDLGCEADVRAVQVNFAEEYTETELPATADFCKGERRAIDTAVQRTRWILKASSDGESYTVIEDKSNAETDLSHDLVVCENGIKARYIRLEIKELPYNQIPCVSGLRVFGKSGDKNPERAKNINAEYIDELDVKISWEAENVVGCNVLWGFAEDKLYHSRMVLGESETELGAIIKGAPLYIRVDTFNEFGITEGEAISVRNA